jgi:starvation-inducible DNA-binding protein
MEDNMNKQDAKVSRGAPLATPTDLSINAVRDISGALNALLADMFAL